MLLELLEQQFESILALKKENQILRDEIARLKNHKPKPKIKPTKLSKDTAKKPPLKESKPKKNKEDS